MRRQLTSLAVAGHERLNPTIAHCQPHAMAMDQNPFKNSDAWRRHPMLNNTWKHGAPGFFIGLAAFSAFYAYDKATSSKTAKH